MCDRNFEVENIFDKKACEANPLNSLDQAFNQSFWNDLIRTKALKSDWLDCAVYGKNEYFVGVLIFNYLTICNACCFQAFWAKIYI